MQNRKGRSLLILAGGLVVVLAGMSMVGRPAGRNALIARGGAAASGDVRGGMMTASGAMTDDRAGTAGRKGTMAGATRNGEMAGWADGVSGGMGQAGEMAGIPEAKEGIVWLKLEDAAGKLQAEQRPVLIDLYTTWCGWCKQMDKKTYSNRQVAAYVQEKFYPVKLDAETKDVINWNGKSYKFNSGYRSNEFAVYLTQGRLEFPTTIIIPPGGEPQAIPGYMEPKELELLVRYFGEGKYNKMSFDAYQKTFKASW